MRNWLLVLLTLVTAMPLWAQSDTIGKITFTDGDVQVLRNGTLMNGDSIDAGFILEDQDQIRTGKGAQAEIALDPKTGINAVVHLKGSSVLNLDITSLKSQQVGNLELLAGAIGLKVQKLTGGNQLNVHTDSAVMGVRGTQFDVDTEISGEVLLTTSEGKVECRTDEGKSLYSIPGSIVQSDEDSVWALHPVEVSGIGTFSQKWHEERQSRFQANTEKIVLRLANRYATLLDRFEGLYSRFQKNDAVVEKWIKEEHERRPFRAADAAREKRLVGVELFGLRALNAPLERLGRRLSRIEETLGPAGIAKLQGRLANGTTLQQFFSRLDAERAEHDRQLARVYFASKLFHKRNGGVLGN